MGSMILFTVLFCILLYVLYINGHMTINAKRAVTFIGSIRGRGKCGASFHSCSGYMKRIMRFKESRVYYFELDVNLVNGELEVEILDREKKPVVHLDGNTPQAELEVDREEQYTLMFRFKSATGDFKLRWE